MAEVPPFIRMSGETSLGHHLVEQTTTLMPTGRLAVRIRFRFLGMVIGNRLITDGIDVTAHVQWISRAIRKGEIHGGTSAMGRWRAGILAGRCPETGYLQLHLL